MPIENDRRMGGALQENVLTVLCFDDARCKQVRAAVTHRTFESAVYREVAGAAIDFIDQYGEAIKEHLPDHLEHVLRGEDERKAKAYERLLDNLFQSRETVNAEYVLDSLQKFVRQQRLKSALIDAVAAIEQNEDIDRAEHILQEGMKAQAVTFDRGLALDNPEDVAAVFDDPEEEGFDLGIPELDSAGNIPRRKELFLLIAPRGKGKSWFVTHCCKQALLQRWSAVVITLEMSQKRYGARFLQSFFAITKDEARVRVTRLEKGRDGALQDVLQEEIERTSMRDPDARAQVLKRAKREFKRRAPLRIKQFPTKQATIEMIEAYLDGLEREGFTPDLICVDYPDLMKLDPKNHRVELGALIERIRGIAVARNAAAVVVSQGNRESERAKLVTGDMVAEDISKLATADVTVTYSQTLEEYALNLARLFVEKARNAKAKQTILISQAYDMGQFVLDSASVRTDDYFDMLDEKAADRGRRGRRRDGDEAAREGDDDRRRGRGRRRDD